MASTLLPGPKPPGTRLLPCLGVHAPYFWAQSVHRLRQCESPTLRKPYRQLSRVTLALLVTHDWLHIQYYTVVAMTKSWFRCLLSYVGAGYSWWEHMARSARLLSVKNYLSCNYATPTTIIPTPISPNPAQSPTSESEISVFLEQFCLDMEERLHHLKYFHKSASLIREGMAVVHSRRFLQLRLKKASRQPGNSMILRKWLVKQVGVKLVYMYSGHCISRPNIVHNLLQYCRLMVVLWTASSQSMEERQSAERFSLKFYFL